MYNQFIYRPILNSLIGLYHLLGDNLGLAIVVLTLVIRGVLFPFALPSLRAAKKMADLKPELDALKRKHGHDPKVFQQKQLEFYKSHNINPASGCLPYLAQFIVLIALYQVFMNTLHGNGMGDIQSQFLIWDLKSKDQTYILPVLAGILQLVTSLALLPAVENEPEKRPGTKEQKEDVAEMATSMQQQMVFMMPIMTTIFALQFPAGLALYWVITTAFSLGQQLLISGSGGLRAQYLKLRRRLTGVSKK
jgi:YidC/Oxa1 family membrane protein insertase